MAEALALASRVTPTDGPMVAHSLQDAVAQEDSAFSYAIAANAFTDAHGSALRLTAQLASGDPLPGWLHFGQTTVAGASAWTLSGTPENADVGSLQIQVSAMNAAGQSISDEFTLAVENVNDAPTVAAPLPAQTVAEIAAWSFVVPEGTFADVDAGDVLTYSATWSNGTPLPSWMTFNPATRTFAGTPTLANAHESMGTGRGVFGPSVPAVARPGVVVTATDIAGATASCAFDLGMLPAATEMRAGTESLAIVNEALSVDLQIQRMIQAMSAYEPPAAGEIEGRTGYREALAMQLAVNAQ